MERPHLPPVQVKGSKCASLFLPMRLYSSADTSSVVCITRLEILQTYYCERLGRAICVNVPTLFWAFYKLVGPFIDPVTKDKIQFNVDASLFIPKEQLQKTAFGGELDFEYVSLCLIWGPSCFTFTLRGKVTDSGSNHE